MASLSSCLLIPYQNDTFVRITSSSVVNSENQIILWLQRENFNVTVWNKVAFFAYSVGNISLFEVCLEKAADMIISTFLYSQKKNSNQYKKESYTNATQNELHDSQQEDETLQREDLNMCTILAGHYIHSLFVCCGWINDKRYKSQCLDPKLRLKKAEELLKKTIILCQLYHDSLQQTNTPCCKKDQLTQKCTSLQLATATSLQGYLELALYSGKYFGNVVDVEDTTNRQKHLVNAFKNFQMVVSLNADCPLAEMGLAACHYAMKNFQQALLLYAIILNKYTSKNTNVRLAMGFCHFHLKNYDRSFSCFERIIQLDPQNTTAKMGLCFFHFLKKIPRSLKSTDVVEERLWKTHVKESTQILLEAYKMDPVNFNTLIPLMDVVFLSERYDLFILLMNHSKRLIKNCLHYAELTYQQGRWYHMNNNTVAAQEQYEECLKWRPFHLSSRFGLAQMLAAQKKWSESAKHLAISLHQYPSHILCLKLYCYICLMRVHEWMQHDGNFLGVKTCFVAQHEPLKEQELNNSSTETCAETKSLMWDCLNAAEEGLQHISKIDPSDRDIALLQIELYTLKEIWGNRTILIQKALPLYEKILQLSWCEAEDTFNEKISSSQCTFLLSHNLGIMYALNQEYTKALRLLDTCLELCNEKQSTKINYTLKPFHDVIALNHALVCEQYGDHSRATRTYRSLTESDSKTSIQVWKRLCQIQISHSCYDQVKKIIDQAVKQNINRAHFSFLMAQVYKRQGKYEKAIKEIQTLKNQNHIVTKAFYETHLGELYHKLAQKNVLKEGKSQSQQAEKFFSKAAIYYMKALQTDSHNWYAANGLSVLLAEHNYLKLALDCFSLLLNVCKTAPQAELMSGKSPTENESNTSPKHHLMQEEKTFQPDNFVLMAQSHRHLRAVCHQNLGLVHASIAFTERKNLSPNSVHSRLDSVKIAKATKHTLSALYCITENAFPIYIQLARLFFDAGKFRQSENILRSALRQWPSCVILHYNLAYVLEQAVTNEMKLPEFMSNPENIEHCIADCHKIEAEYTKLLGFIKSFSPLKSESFENLRKYILQLFCGRDTTCLAPNDKSLRYVIKLWGTSTGLPLPHEFLHLLPSEAHLSASLERVRTSLKPELIKKLPQVTNEWNTRKVNERVLQAEMIAQKEAKQMQSSYEPLCKSQQENGKFLPTVFSEDKNHAALLLLTKPMATSNEDENCHVERDIVADDKMSYVTKPVKYKNNELNNKSFSSNCSTQQQHTEQENLGKRISSLEFSFDTIKKQKHN